MKHTLVMVVGLVVLGLVVGFGLWTSYQGALGWQDAYTACVQAGNSPLECRVRVSGG